MKTRSYKEVVDFISQILMASSNVRSVSLITPRGTLDKMEQDIPRLTKYIIRLLQQHEMIYDYE